MVNKKKILIVFIYIVCSIGILIVLNFLPTWKLQTKNMTKVEGEWVDVYYESEEEAALDVFKLANKETANIAKRLGISEKQDVKIYIYDNQIEMQRKKYGFIAPLLGLDWYIGDNIGTDVILISPANPGKVHSYDENKAAVLHEIVHAYISSQNPDINLWLTEGTALYLTNGEEFYKEYLDSMEIPSYSDTKTSNPVYFSKCGGYLFSRTYIEYLDKTYGWNKVCKLIRTEDYKNIFDKNDKEIYTEWINYLNNYYQ